MEQRLHQCERQIKFLTSIVKSIKRSSKHIKNTTKNRSPTAKDDLKIYKKDTNRQIKTKKLHPALSRKLIPVKPENSRSVILKKAKLKK